MIYNIPVQIIFENYEEELMGIPRSPKSSSAELTTGTRPPMVIWNQSEDPDDMEEFEIAVPPSSHVNTGGGPHAPDLPLNLSKTGSRQGEGPTT